RCPLPISHTAAAVDGVRSLEGKGCGWRRSQNAVTRFCGATRAALCSMQMRTLVFTLMSIVCSLALAGVTVYRWVDEQGIVHYSDQPHANAEKVHVNAAQTY